MDHARHLGLDKVARTRSSLTLTCHSRVISSHITRPRVGSNEIAQTSSSVKNYKYTILTYRNKVKHWYVYLSTFSTITLCCSCCVSLTGHTTLQYMTYGLLKNILWRADIATRRLSWYKNFSQPIHKLVHYLIIFVQSFKAYKNYCTVLLLWN